jgi:GntR family transcriptional repressor for pyruvate dehydrogenase complex
MRGTMQNSKVKFEFETVRKSKVFEEVAKQIQQRIIEQLKPGDVLPPERELAGMFGVSRSSVREAIRSLEVMGLVEPRRRVGTLVREVNAVFLLHPLTTALLQSVKMNSELLDVRRIIEPPLARRAALNATPSQIADLEEILRRQEERITRGELGMEEDSAFHYSIARAADNAVVLKVVDVIMDLLREARQHSLEIEGRALKSFQGHCRILGAIKLRDAAAAEEAMRRHLDEIAAIVPVAVSKNGDTVQFPGHLAGLAENAQRQPRPRLVHRRVN